MQLGSPFDALANALASGRYKDLPSIKYQRKDYQASKEHGRDVFVRETRVPEIWEIEVTLFPQTWSDTSIGFGGMAGQAFTSAYTVILTHDHETYCVYFGGSLAYRININDLDETGLMNFKQDMGAQNMASVRDATRLYTKVKTDAASTEESPEIGSPQDRF